MGLFYDMIYNRFNKPVNYTNDCSIFLQANFCYMIRPTIFNPDGLKLSQSNCCKSNCFHWLNFLFLLLACSVYKYHWRYCHLVKGHTADVNVLFK